MQTRPKGLDSEAARRVIKTMSGLHVRLYRLTRGRLGGHWRVGAGLRTPVRICLLEHRGRRTGQLRTTPLVYIRDGEDVVVVASQGGRAEHPQWYRNLQADPEVTVELHGERLPRRARTASPAERARLWPRLVEAYADFDNYQSWAGREIPVVVLEPR